MKLQSPKETFYNTAKRLGISDADSDSLWEVFKGEPLALNEKSLELMIEEAFQKYHHQQLKLW